MEGIRKTAMNAGSEKNRRSEREELVRNIPFFSPLLPEEMDDLLQRFVEKHFLRNRIILLEEDTQNYMYIIRTGKVKAVHQDEDGREHILAIHKRGDFFGEMALLDGKTAPATVIAMEDSSVLILAKTDFDILLTRNPAITRQLILTLCARLREAWMMLKALNISDTEQRIRTILTILSMQNSIPVGRGTKISLILTHQDIADYAALSRETVTRFIGKLVRSGEIDTSEGRHLVLLPSFFKKAPHL